MATTAREAKFLELLKTLHEFTRLEHSDSEGYTNCPYCSASGWGFLEHDEDCPVLEVRSFLGNCRHGFPGNYNHGDGDCPPLKEKSLEEPGLTVVEYHVYRKTSKTWRSQAELGARSHHNDNVYNILQTLVCKGYLETYSGQGNSYFRRG